MFDIIIIQGSNQFPWKDVLISVGVPLIVAFMSWWGNRSAVKINRETLENAKDAAPPELLRLEKWSTIVKDLEKYPERVKSGLKIENIYNTYNDILNRATLENRVISLGILSEEIRRELININLKTGDGNYPRYSRGTYRYKEWYIFLVIMLLAFSFLMVYNIIFSIVEVLQGEIQGWMMIILSIIVILSLCSLFKNIYIVFDEVREKNIIFRNGYHALRDVYLARKSIELIESSKERMEREEFEKSRTYKRWKNKVKREHPKWESWNYGLDIGCNNKPEISGDIKTSKIRSIVLWCKSLIQNFLRKALRGENSNPSSGA